MGAAEVGPGAGELGDLVDQEPGIAGLKPGQTGFGQDKDGRAADLSHDRPEILCDTQRSPFLIGDNHHAADRSRRGPGLAGLPQRLAQPDGIVLEIRIDHRFLGRPFLGPALQYRLRQTGHISRGQVPFTSQAIRLHKT